MTANLSVLFFRLGSLVFVVHVLTQTHDLCFAVGGRTIASHAPDLPWCGTKKQIEKIQKRCEITSDADMFDDTICIPSEFAGVHFEKAFGKPGALKSHEKLLMAGPMGKYLLEGCMHPAQQEVVKQSQSSASRSLSSRSQTYWRDWSGCCQLGSWTSTGTWSSIWHRQYAGMAHAGAGQCLVCGVV